MDAQTLEAICRFIAKYLEEHNQLSPTIREIAAGCYLSKAAVQRCLDILEARGKISRISRAPRSIRLISTR